VEGGEPNGGVERKKELKGKRKKGIASKDKYLTNEQHERD